MRQHRSKPMQITPHKGAYLYKPSFIIREEQGTSEYNKGKTYFRAHVSVEHYGKTMVEAITKLSEGSDAQPLLAVVTVKVSAAFNTGIGWIASAKVETWMETTRHDAVTALEKLLTLTPTKEEVTE